MAIQTFRDLIVWQKSMDLVIACYGATTRFPASERYGLAGQLQRAAVSVPANIAEGRARGFTKEFIRHVGIASGSLAELETHVELALRLRYIEATESKSPCDLAVEIGKMLNALQTSLRARLK